MRQLTRRLRLLAGFVAIGFGVLFGKSGSWALSRYFQIAMPLDLTPAAADVNANVTVIVPAHNVESRVAGLVECLQRQQYPLFRCIIVDDGSADDTLAQARRCTESDPRFTIVALGTNCGVSAARNVGIALTATEFLMFLDADDFLTPEAIGSRVERLRKDPTATGAFGHAMSVVDGKDWRKVSTKTMDKADRRVTLETSAGEMPFLIHQVLMRTSAAIEIGGFDERYYRGCEDTEFWCRSLRSGHEYVDTQARDCLYVQRQGSLVDTRMTEYADTFSRLIADNLSGQAPVPMVTTAHRVDGRIADLVEQAVMQRRAFKTLGLMTAGDAEDVLPPAMLAALTAPRVLSNSSAIFELRSGVSRSLNRAGSANQRLADEGVAAAAHRYRDFLLPDCAPEPLPMVDQPGWAVLVCDASQLAEVELAIANLPTTDAPVLLMADALSSAGSAIDSSEVKQRTESVLRYLLLGCVYETVLVPDHDCDAARLVAAAAAARGSKVVTWSPTAGAPGLIPVARIGEYAVTAPESGVPRLAVAEPVLTQLPEVFASSHA